MITKKDISTLALSTLALLARNMASSRGLLAAASPHSVGYPKRHTEYWADVEAFENEVERLRELAG